MRVLLKFQVRRFNFRDPRNGSLTASFFLPRRRLVSSSSPRPWKEPCMCEQIKSLILHLQTDFPNEFTFQSSSSTVRDLKSEREDFKGNQGDKGNTRIPQRTRPSFSYPSPARSLLPRRVFGCRVHPWKEHLFEQTLHVDWFLFIQIIKIPQSFVVERVGEEGTSRWATKYKESSQSGEDGERKPSGESIGAGTNAYTKPSWGLA